jgi:Homeodomain-like domain
MSFRGESLGLTDIVDTSGPPRGRRIRDREKARTGGDTTAGDHSGCPGGDGNVSLSYRYFGITRQAFQNWLRRYEDHGVDGLRDRSRRPHTIANATKAEVVGKIVCLRQHYHFRPHKIAAYLKRYHEIQISPSGIWRILKRPGHESAAGIPAIPTARGPLEALRDLPGHRVQIDVKFIAPLQGSRKKYYQVAGIDDCTRIRSLGSTTGSTRRARSGSSTTFRRCSRSRSR